MPCRTDTADETISWFQSAKVLKIRDFKVDFWKFVWEHSPKFLMDRGYDAPPHILPLLAAPTGPLVSPSALPRNEADLWVHYQYLTCTACESAVCDRIESRIEYFQLHRILITKISNYKWNKWDVWNYIFLITILKHIKLYRRMITHRASKSVYCTTNHR